jgi:DNA-directed RNA polymerase subunit RPC12/RpoP
MSVMTYTCQQCGDTSRNEMEVIKEENWCDYCQEEASK